MIKLASKRGSKSRPNRKGGTATATAAKPRGRNADRVLSAESTSSLNPNLSLDTFETKVLSGYAENHLSGMEVMWRQGELCNVSILTGDKRFRAHKCVLASCADYFHSVFTNTPLEQHQEVRLDFGLPTTIFSIIECMYTGKVNINEANVKDLLLTSARLNFFAVEEACGDFLMSRLNRSSCLRMLNLAATYDLASLTEQALHIAAANFLEVTDGFDFQHLEISQLMMLLERDDIEAGDHGELEVFRRALSWIEYEKPTRRKYASHIMNEIRLPLLTPTDIVDHVETVDYLMDIPDCQILVKEALHYHCMPARQSILQTSRTVPRSSHAKTCLMAVGGAPRLKSDPVSRRVSYFDIETNKWGILTHLMEPRHHHAVAVLGNFMYVAGGEETNDQRSPLNTAFRYNPRNNKWLQIASMRNRRESFQLGVLSGKLYAVGGRVDADKSLAEVERYNPSTDEWEKVPPISAPRRSVAVATLNGRLYAMGGSGNKRISSKVERYNPLSNQWEMRRPLSTPRFFALIAPLAGKLFLVGGATVDSAGNVVCVDKVECYTPVTDQWVTISPMIESRAEAGLAIAHNRIYVVGGYSWNTNKRLKSVEYYDLEKEKWFRSTDIATPYTGVGCCSLTIYHFPEKEPSSDSVSGLDVGSGAVMEGSHSTMGDVTIYSEGDGSYAESTSYVHDRPDTGSSYVISKAPSLPY